MNAYDENDERKFLHDIATPTCTAIFVIDTLLDDVKNRPNAKQEEIEQLKQIFNSLEKIKKAIEARKEKIKRFAKSEEV